MSLVREVVERVTQILDPAYLVGGSVRDALMGRECVDFDFATPLDPELIEQAVRAAGRRPYLVGKRYGTIAFRLDGLSVEVTTFRSEVYREQSRKPSVEFLPDLELDLSRRDFTINAMALHGDELIDLFGGRADLEAGIVRAVGDPLARFTEDPLRMLRAARFVSELNFSIDEHTAGAMTELAPRILSVARERWMIELDRLLVGRGVGAGLRLLADTGLLRFILPEIALQPSIAVEPAENHTTLFDRTVAAVYSAPDEPTARWAALMRDAGAPYAPPAAGNPESHDGLLLSAEIVERTALYLKWPKRMREDVKRAVAWTEPGPS